MIRAVFRILRTEYIKTRTHPISDLIKHHSHLITRSTYSNNHHIYLRSRHKRTLGSNSVHRVTIHEVKSVIKHTKRGAKGQNLQKIELHKPVHRIHSFVIPPPTSTNNAFLKLATPTLAFIEYWQSTINISTNTIHSVSIAHTHLRQE